MNSPAHAAGPAAPISAHFVNNVLAAAASYIEDDPDYARDILAELGQFLSYRLRDAPAPVSVSQEIEHVANFLRLQQARFPDRITSDMARASGAGTVEPGSLQRPVAEALGRRLSASTGPCQVSLSAVSGGFELRLEGPPGSEPERVGISLNAVEGVSS